MLIVFGLAVACVFVPELGPILAASAVLTLVRAVLVASDRVVAAVTASRRD